MSKRPHSGPDTFTWATFGVSTVVSAAGWAFWAEVFGGAVTAVGFALTLALLAGWVATRERYPLSLLVGAMVGLCAAFPLLYARESPLWVVGLLMILTAVGIPLVAVFLVARLVVSRRPHRGRAPVED